MCTILLLLKISMDGFHQKLVKDILRTFQNSDLICGSLFGILRSVRLQKILGNQKYGQGLHTKLEVKCDTTLIQMRKIQSTSIYQSSEIGTGTLVWTRITPTDTQSKCQNSMTRSQVLSTNQMISFMGIWIQFYLIAMNFQGRQNNEIK